MKEILFLLMLSLLISVSEAAPPLDLTHGDSVVVSCPSCPPSSEPPKLLKMPGNAHAVIHSTNAKLLGYAKCQECHSLDSTTPAKVSATGTFLCSQYDFCTSGTIAGTSQCQKGVTFKHPISGDTIVDPVTQTAIVTGKDIGGYAPGSIPSCRDCHFPHKTTGERVSARNVHQGCLDCHVRPGSGERRPGIDDKFKKIM